MPRGGGVLLSLELEKLRRPQATIIFDPHDSEVDGKAEPWLAHSREGDYFRLLPAAVREGYRFVGWYPKLYGASDPRWKDPDPDNKTNLPAGGEMLVDGNRTLTAVCAPEA